MSSLDEFLRLSAVFGFSDPEVILDVGSRDGQEALAFATAHPKARVYFFECNPATLPLCRKVEGLRENLQLVEKAVSDRDGLVQFYPIDPALTETTWEDGNPGASSLFQASGKYPVERYVQTQIEVESIRLDTFLRDTNLPRIDLLWMDVQGAEEMVCKGLGERLSDVGLIHTEVEFIEIYSGQVLFPELKKLLHRAGFVLVGFTHLGTYSADAVFVNRDWLSRRMRARARGRALLCAATLCARRVARPAYERVGARLRRLGRAARLTASRIVTALGPAGPRLAMRRLCWLAWLVWIKPALRLDPNLCRAPVSDLEIDVVVVAGENDLDILPRVLRAARESIRHPLGRFYVIAGRGGAGDICEKEGAVFIDEDSIAPIARARINYTVNGIDRSGWLFQQLLKLASAELVEKESFLVLDADTLLTRPQIFWHRDGPVVNHSLEYHRPYVASYQRLLGIPPRSPLSFIAHHMLWQKSVLTELKREIGALHSKPWYEAIVDATDRHQSSGFSEYELYGNFLLSKMRSPITRLYSFNRVQARTDIPEMRRMRPRRRVKSISFHSYLRSPSDQASGRRAGI
ncbi:MAG: FkbM family methyltransferase [Gaiellaceae bacterium]